MTTPPTTPDPFRDATTRFTTTHWTVVLAAGQERTSDAAVALETLCRAYWYPLYAFIRRRGYQVADAQDLTQAFFERLLEKDYLRAVDPRKGKFRSFLLAALEHFLANEWRRNHAQKRGGKFAFVSLDDTSAEEHYRQVPASNRTPEQIYEQQWAIVLLDGALTRLRQEFVASRKEALFEETKIFLTGEKHAATYSELAARLGMSEAALKMAVSRMRQRYGELLRSEVANTVSGSDEAEQELRALLNALGA